MSSTCANLSRNSTKNLEFLLKFAQVELYKKREITIKKLLLLILYKWDNSLYNLLHQRKYKMPRKDLIILFNRFQIEL